jgi:hypothetical protein
MWKQPGHVGSGGLFDLLTPARPRLTQSRRTVHTELLIGQGHVIKRKRGPGFDTTRGDAESIRVPYRRKTQQFRRGPRLPDSISRRDRRA